MKTTLTRRDALKTTALLLGAGLTGNLAAKVVPSFHLGACDWSIGPRLNPATFEIASKIGLQGLQVSYNTKEDEAGLSVPATLKGIKEAARRSGIVVSSVAIGELNRVPYKSEPRTEEWVWNSVDAAKALGVKVILLAFFNNGELRDDEAGQKMVIERLKKGGTPRREAGHHAWHRVVPERAGTPENHRRRGFQSREGLLRFPQFRRRGPRYLRRYSVPGQRPDLRTPHEGKRLPPRRRHHRLATRGNFTQKKSTTGAGMQIEGATPKGANVVWKPTSIIGVIWKDFLNLGKLSAVGCRR